MENVTKYTNLSNNEDEIIQNIIDHLSRMEYEKAENEAEKLKNPIDKYYNKACISIRKQDYNSAESHLLKAIRNGDDYSIYLLAELYEKELNDYQKAKEYYLKIEPSHSMYTSALYNLGRLYQLKFKDYKNAEKYYYKAYNTDLPDAMIDLLLMFLQKKINSKLALKYVIEYNKKYNSIQSKLLYIIIHLWNNKIEIALQSSLNLFENENPNVLFNCLSNKDESLNYFLFKYFFLLLLAKKQYHFTYDLFKKNNQLVNELKPLYYATLHFLGSARKDEYLKMGSELTETVEEIIEEVKRYEYEYNSNNN